MELFKTYFVDREIERNVLFNEAASSWNYTAKTINYLLHAY
jgi:hypothetical protein